MVHGTILWGTALGLVMCLGFLGVRGGYHALLLGVNAGATFNRDRTAEEVEESLRRAGASQATLDEWKEKAKGLPARAREVWEDPETRRQATAASWWALAGTVLSMVAAIGGALVGSGPTFRLFTTPGGALRMRVDHGEPVAHA